MRRSACGKVTATTRASRRYSFDMAERKTFEGLTADAFVTDADRKALRALERVPLLPAVLRKFHDLGADRWFYCMNMANAVRCGPKQYHTLYGMFQEACAIMDMPEPKLYVANKPLPKAFAAGV